MKLQTLGGLRLEPATFTQPKPLLLLVYLSLEGQKSRRHLAELFWPEGNRMKSLSMTLTRLRQGAGMVVEADDRHAWTSLMTDTHELLGALDACAWQKATACYRGAFLADIHLEDWNSELEDWVYSTREYLAERVQHALLNQAEIAANRQDFKQAAQLAEHAYKLPGLSGNSPVTLKRLYSLLCAGNSLLAANVRKEAEAFDIALELTTAAARTQFGGAETTRALAPVLPIRNTTFVGRDIELAELTDLLHKPEVVLLSIVGAGGVGKTRLALQIAHEQQRLNGFSDGVHVVLLEALQDAKLIPQMLLSHFAIPLQQEPLQQLTDFLTEKQLLLILDNFEHLIAAAPLLSHLLSHCPKLKLLVTSRETLKLEEEQVFTLEGLTYPEVASDDAHLSDALRLFEDRAKQRDLHFELARQLPGATRICQLLDGLPLGIELAATWVKLLPCADIAKEIEANLEFLTSNHHNIPERHRSLKAVFESSWNRLTHQEQQVLGKLSVFRGGFRREAASEVAGATLSLLASLVDKSLLRVLPNGRYDRHPLLYQFTQEKLSIFPEDRAQLISRHTAYYLRLAARAETSLYSEQRATWLRQFDEESDNLREVLNHAKDRQDYITGLILATALADFWHTRGYYKEACDYLEHFLSTDAVKPPKLHAKALNTLADLAWQQGDIDKAKACLEDAQLLSKRHRDLNLQSKTLGLLARIYHYNLTDPGKAQSLYEQSIVLADRANNQAQQAATLNLLAILVSERGDLVAAQGYYHQSLQLWQSLDNKSGIAFVLNNLANIHNSRSESTTAAQLFEQSLQLFRELGERDGVAMALGNLGIIQSQLGNYSDAQAYLAESLLFSRTAGDKRHMAFLLCALGRIAFYQKDNRRAQTLLQESYTIYQKLGYSVGMSDALTSLAEVQHAEGDWASAEATYQQALTLCRQGNDSWGIAQLTRQLATLCLDQKDYATVRPLLHESLAVSQELKSQTLTLLAIERFAELAGATGQLEQAILTIAVTDAERQQYEIRRDPYEQVRYRHTLERLQTFSDFDAVYLRGTHLTHQDAVALCQQSERNLTLTPKNRQQLSKP